MPKACTEEGFQFQAWNLAWRNLANRGPRNANSFRQDLHPDLKLDLVPVRKDLANPPFNMSDWCGENLRQDVRWKFGMPPVNNANYAWIQHFIHHLSPAGVAGFVMANGSMSTQTSNEDDRDERCTPITDSETAPENCVTLCLNR